MSESFIQRKDRERIARMDWMTNDRYRLWLHILFWLFFFFNDILSILGISSYITPPIPTVLLLFLIDIVSVYFILYVLVPAYFMKNQIIMFLAFTLIIIFMNIEAGFLLRQISIDMSSLGVENESLSLLFEDFFSTTFMVVAAVGAHSLRSYMISLNKLKTLESTNLRTELMFLKNQINPHFLFNSLNSIYVQTRKKRLEEAESSILMLSDILRYQLYDCSKEKVLLKNEISYLENYIEMETQRRSETSVNFEINGNINNQMVAPFLFITFVENAFKHGQTNDALSFVDITLDITEDSLDFKVLNTKKKTTRENKGPGGIGLRNVKRRLELVYPKNHELNLEDREDEFLVHLQLNI